MRRNPTPRIRLVRVLFTVDEFRRFCAMCVAEGLDMSTCVRRRLFGGDEADGHANDRCEGHDVAMRASCPERK